MNNNTAKTIIFITFLGALFTIMQFYVWKVLPAIDGVRMYELEREVGLIP